METVSSRLADKQEAIEQLEKIIAMNQNKAYRTTLAVYRI